jgi:hypothetical protein
MSTSTQTLPARRSTFTAVWIAVVAAVIAAAIVLGLALMRSPAATNKAPSRPTTNPVADTQAGKPYHPFIVNGQICGQCR